ncbi:hypothetical protein E6C60_0974 [Paenibacillus algicola]|uniref:Uncharacterized protein n=1 Tax=Paenibacillus algicola TaxID=2565926 RepID=A0A4P8XGT4_9BACL|nr:hypothetical protein [Paenibacillus algicola]QCT01692.1 hypothetical protein E6C60_0974 [Paenibacillus algicola]
MQKLKTRERIGISSPTTSLPEQQFIELRACIEEANHILRSLGNPKQPENPRQLQLKLASLINKHVKLNIAYQGMFKSLQGILVQAGRNYVQLCTGSHQRYVMFDDLISVTTSLRSSKFPHHTDNPYLSNKLNCQILYNYSDTVSGSVRLLNRFYGIPLSVALLEQVGRKIRVRHTPNVEVSGILLDTTEQAIVIRTAKKRRTIERVPFEKIEIVCVDQ